jgi:1,4-dihydroxy-2-naphthoate octaprenyltransferase
MQDVFGPLRPPFLILAPACVALGLAMAYRSGAPVSTAEVLLVILGAVAAHGAVNALNEYFDFRCGLDARTLKTPFSGGSGTLPAHPEQAPTALGLGLGGAALTLAVGAYFISAQGWALFPVGLLGLVLVLAYTPWLTRRAWLCLVAPGLGFGPCMVVGTEAALTGQATAAAWFVSLVPFFLVNNLLLLNQFPDVDADRAAGRRNLPILIGRRRSAVVYAIFFAAAAAALAASVSLGFLPAGGLAGFLGLAPGILVLRDLAQGVEDAPALLPGLALNVVVSIATPALAAAGAFLG